LQAFYETFIGTRPLNTHNETKPIEKRIETNRTVAISNPPRTNVITTPFFLERIKRVGIFSETFQGETGTNCRGNGKENKQENKKESNHHKYLTQKQTKTTNHNYILLLLA
jgi:hypothetical protein